MAEFLKEFNKWLRESPRGDCIAYHTGFLWVDRAHSTTLDALGDAAWRAHEAGDCVLVQRRVSPGVCDYLAIKR